MEREGLKRARERERRKRICRPHLSLSKVTVDGGGGRHAFNPGKGELSISPWANDYRPRDASRLRRSPLRETPCCTTPLPAPPPPNYSRFSTRFSFNFVRGSLSLEKEREKAMPLIDRSYFAFFPRCEIPFAPLDIETCSLFRIPEIESIEIYISVPYLVFLLEKNKILNTFALVFIFKVRNRVTRALWNVLYIYLL